MRAMPSIIAKLRKNLIERQANRTYTLTKKKEFHITLAPYEATFLEIYIREILLHIPYGYERSVSMSVADTIHQTLS